MNFIQNKDIGYYRNQVLIINNTHGMGSSAKVFKDEVLKLNGVQNETITGHLPAAGWRCDSPFFPSPSVDPKNAVGTLVWRK